MVVYVKLKLECQGRVGTESVSLPTRLEKVRFMGCCTVYRHLLNLTCMPVPLDRAPAGLPPHHQTNYIGKHWSRRTHAPSKIPDPSQSITIDRTQDGGAGCQIPDLVTGPGTQASGSPLV